MFNLSKKDFKRMDYILLFLLVGIIIFGLVVLNSAMHPLSSTIQSQAVATIFGFIFMAFIFIIDLDFIKKIKWVIYFISIVLLIATIFLGYGGEQWGANLWLNIGPFNLQPSELSKIFHIIFLSAFIGDNKRNINSTKFILKFLALGYFPVILIIIQRDLGTAMVLFFITTVMFFLSGISWSNIIKLLGISLVLLLISLPVIWANLEEHAKERILDFGNSNRNLSTSTHQTDRGLIALGSGKLTGRGYMSGPFSQNRYIPEQHTDFIFPVLVEDFGFLGGATAILMYFLILYRLIQISKDADSLYHSTLIIGVFSMIFIHIFENIGMTMGIMPVTGIPLPFFSHGGTFQLINIILMGLCLSISTQRKSLEF